jgi:hypothetical protein
MPANALPRQLLQSVGQYAPMDSLDLGASNSCPVFMPVVLFADFLECVVERRGLPTSTIPKGPLQERRKTE